MATIKAIKCLRTGMLYPADYVEYWGRKYGIGLGPVPVSEALTNCYEVKSARSSDGKEMYPVQNCYGPIQEVDVTPEEFEESKAVIALDDPGMQKRGPIMRSRQIAHGRIKAD